MFQNKLSLLKRFCRIRLLSLTLLVVLSLTGTSLITQSISPKASAQSKTSPVTVEIDAYLKNNNLDITSKSFGEVMTISGDTLAISQVDGIAIFRRIQGTWQKEAQLTLPDAPYWVANPSGLALDGKRLLVSRPEQDLEQNGNTISKAGIVYIFERDSNNSWQLQGQILPPSPRTDGLFGFAVDILGDTAVIADMGGTDHPSIRYPSAFSIFQRNQAGQWIQQFHKEGTEVGLRYAFDVALDTDLVAVSNMRRIEHIDYLYSSDAQSNQIEPSQPTNSSVEVYRRTGSTWQLESTLYSYIPNSATPDNFGYSIDIDAGTIVVGAPRDENQAFGVHSEIELPIGGGSRLGAAYIFEQASQGDWSKITYLKANEENPDARFGYTVAIDGNNIVVGAPFYSGNSDSDDPNYQGAAHLFVKTAEGWQASIQFLAPNPDPKDYFGYSTVLSGDLIAIGAPNEASGATGINGDQTDNSIPGTGAVYSFQIKERSDNQPPENMLKHKVYLPMIQH